MVGFGEVNTVIQINKLTPVNNIISQIHLLSKTEIAHWLNIISLVVEEIITQGIIGSLIVTTRLEDVTAPGQEIVPHKIPCKTAPCSFFRDQATKCNSSY